MKRAVIVLGGVIVFAACAVAATHSWTTAQPGEYWTDPSTGERIEILKSRPVPIAIPWAHFMLIGRDERLSQRP
jgi:hypothetical protein